MQALSTSVKQRSGLDKASNRAIFGWVLWVGLSACVPAPATEQALAAEPGQLLSAIVQLPGDVDCDTASQCFTVPVGEKACGGPQRWLAWSSKRISQAELRRLQAGQIDSTARLPRRPGERSDCMVLPDPGAQCLAGRCVLLQGPASLR